ncbi:MAG: four helix bundle protein [Candidatus Absconditabacterales bacterium]
MFDFEKFPVYTKSEETYSLITKNIFPKSFDRNLKDQLQRASTSIILNIAEGAGKYSKADKKNYYLTARGSVHECVAIIRILKAEGIIDEKTYLEIYSMFEEISKMLSGLINTFIKH